MTAFQISELVKVDVSDLAVGQLFVSASQRHGSEHALGVRCAEYNNSPLGTVLRATPSGLELTAFRSGQASGITAIKLHVSDLRFEVDSKSSSPVAAHGEPGMLVVSAEGPFLSVRNKDPRYDAWDTAYLSLSDWTKHDYMPSAASVFASWKLVATQYGKRVVLFESIPQVAGPA